MRVSPFYFIGGGLTFFQQGEGDKQFCILGKGDKHFYIKGGTFYFGGGGGYDDVDKEKDLSKANIPFSKASKLSSGARRSLKF